MAHQSRHRKNPESQLRLEGVSLDKLNLREFDGAVSERFGIVCGIDEAGRGPVAGAVYAAAVVLDPAKPVDGLNDSKKLSPRERERLFSMITERALAFCIASASVEEIDGTDILSAALLAMERAFGGLTERVGVVLIDGDVLPELDAEMRGVIGGDAKSESIAAASILAKVTRDREMCALAAEYPGYGLEKHKGYGTKAHYEAIERLGLSPAHRKTFLKKYAGANGRSG